MYRPKLQYVIIVIIIIIWGANHPYSQLEQNCEGRGYNVFEQQACKGAFSCQPRQPIMTSEHSQDQKCLISPEGGKPDGLENPRGTAENQCTTQLTSTHYDHGAQPKIETV